VLPSVTITVRLEKRKSKHTTENTEQITQKQAELKALNVMQAEIETKISDAATDADAKAKLANQLAEMQKARDKLCADISELLVSQADTETNKRTQAEMPTHEASALRLTFPDKIQLDQLLPGTRKRVATLCLTVLAHLVKQSLIEQLTGHQRALDALIPTSVAAEMTKGGYPIGNSLYLITGTHEGARELTEAFRSVRDSDGQYLYTLTFWHESDDGELNPKDWDKVQFDVGTITRHEWTKEFLSFALDSDATLTRQIKEDSGLIEALEPRNLTPDEGHLFAMSMVVTKRLNESKTSQRCVVCGGLDYGVAAMPLREDTYICHVCWGVSLPIASKLALTAVKSPESEKTRTHPAQSFAQLFGPFSYKYWV
jgi:hypothetical protein